MWKDTRETRRKRYENYLKLCRTLYVPTESLKQNPNQEENDPMVDRDVCNYVLSPALNGYVLWVLREAIASGKKRLYFLARDGYLMYRAAQILCERLDLNLDCRYLCCSRYSLRIPVYHLDHEGALEYICRGGIDVTIKRILDRTGLSEEEKEEVFAEMNQYFCGHNRREYRLDESVSYAELSSVRAGLEHSPCFWTYLDRHSKDAMPLLEGYLMQEGLLDDIPMALVDSGWVGSMQKVLDQILDYLSDKNGIKKRNSLEGYYWGLYELPADVKPQNYHCYYFSPYCHLQAKVYFSNCLFECVFSAPHGMTMGYTRDKQEYLPVYGKISEANRNFIRQTEQRLMAYTDALAGELEKRTTNVLTCEDDRKAIRKLLGTFMGEPTQEEAIRFGQLSFTDDVLESRGRKLAEPMSDAELAENHMIRKAIAMFASRRGSIKESAWYEGSAVNNGKHVGRHLRRYAGYKYLLYLRKKHMWRKNHE